MYVYCHLALMIVQGSLFPLILGCSRESIPFAFLFSKLILLMVCSRESVSFAWVCLYIFTAGLQLVFFFFLSIQFLYLIKKKKLFCHKQTKGKLTFILKTFAESFSKKNII
jgi:hypothetical protein